MRITNSHRGHNTNLAKCSNMTEGEHRIHGMNGVTDSGSAALTEDNSQPSDAYNLGGRLKFFKNGRFILELARAREGEKVAWVPVPKKTFWPPQGSASSVSTYRQESSTSLSVSDDNSSVQSSPWQRDHTWKQTSPQRSTSNHLSFYFFARGTRRPKPPRCVHRLQRAPYSTPNIASDSRNPCIKCNTSVNKSAIKPSLVHIVQLLWNKSLQALNSITSPRKRILRELERVTIDDLSLKRCRGKVAPKVPVSETSLNGNNCVEEQCIATSSVSSVKNSYSITSLLAKNETRQENRHEIWAESRQDGRQDREKDRDDKLSSQNVLTSKLAHQRTATVAAVDDDRVRERAVVTTAANLSYGQDVIDGAPRTPEVLSTKRSPIATPAVAGRSPSLSASPTASTDHYNSHSFPAHAAAAAAAYMPPYHMYGVLGPPPSLYYNAYSRGFYPNPGPGFIPPQTTHHQPYSWHLPQPTYNHTIHTDDSDVPLNLSKHAD